MYLSQLLPCTFLYKSKRLIAYISTILLLLFLVWKARHQLMKISIAGIHKPRAMGVELHTVKPEQNGPTVGIRKPRAKGVQLDLHTVKPEQNGPTVGINKPRAMGVELHDIVVRPKQHGPQALKVEAEHPTVISHPKETECPTGKCEGNYSFTKSFLYLIQTESCLPKFLLSSDVLGDMTQCRCDILVLSFADKCEGDMIPHVKYLFNSSTTWTTGRNMLYNSVMKRQEKYLYYIFIDDDVILKMKKNDTSNPWRVFEDSLIRLQPPVAAADREDQGRVDKVIAHLLSKKCKLNVDFLPTTSFDAMFSAFHYKAIDNILPYYDKFDNQSWWNSQRQLSQLAFIMYRTQVVFHTKLVVENPSHSNYPKQPIDDKIYKEITDDLIQAIRKRYPKCPELLNQRWQSPKHMALKYCNKPSLPYPPFTDLSQC